MCDTDNSWNVYGFTIVHFASLCSKHVIEKTETLQQNTTTSNYAYKNNYVAYLLHSPHNAHTQKMIRYIKNKHL